MIKSWKAAEIEAFGVLRDLIVQPFKDIPVVLRQTLLADQIVFIQAADTA